jgi:hypothetical protein
MLLVVVFLLSQPVTSQEVYKIREYNVKQAQQAVAVDKNYFYVINSSTITKHSKKEGNVIHEWDGAPLGIKHLNSGVIIKGKLYCVNTNYPDSPMASSVEIFNAKDLTHAGSFSFGIFEGSATWIDFTGGRWYAGFAHYSGSGSSEGKDTKWTRVVAFDKQWRRTESWIFPESVADSFRPSSNSGGTWGRNGFLYCTGHDKPEVYVMEIPSSGYTLKHIKTMPTPFFGQGIAFDRFEKEK